MRRALVTLPDGVWKVIDKELKGKIGDGDSEVIRNLIITHLAEKGYLLPSKDHPTQFTQIADEIEMLDTMVNALAEIMEEKGHMRYSDFESRIRKKLTAKKA